MKKGVAFDVNKFIDSFLSCLSQGTLVIPTFTDHLFDGMTFDRSKSKPNIGSLAVAAYKRDDALRTSDPFHSVAVWGKHAALFDSITDHHTFGKGSAFGLLHQLKAKMLMIDVSFDKSFTFVHYCEEQAQVPWRKQVKHRLEIVDKHGQEQWDYFWFYSRRAGYINTFKPLETIFAEENISRTYEFNNIPIKIIDLYTAYDRILLDINENKGRNLHQFSFYEWLRVVAKKILKR
jgi:aminoglycoside 3-N-acetyltransferase